MIIQFIPIMVVQAVLGIIMYKLARRVRMAAWPAFFCVLPVVGTFVVLFYQYRALFVLADRVEALESAR